MPERTVQWCSYSDHRNSLLVHELLQFGTVARLNSSVTEKRRRYQLDLIQPCNTATDLDITDFLWPLCPHELVRVDRTC